jgi:hypothetical protein
LAAAEYRTAEVLVFREQKPLFRLRTRRHFCVAIPRRDLRHIDRVVSRRTQVRYQSDVDTFIDKPARG